MPTVSNYPYGFPSGVVIRGTPLIQTHPGKAFWLSNSGVLTDNEKSASDGNKGTFQAPFSTLSGALAQCTANRGDIIFVKPGHAETISTATALTLSVAGVAIVGLGSGTKRPTFTLDTATTATINVTAANVMIYNCVFTANFADVVSCFTLTTAKGFNLQSCEFNDNASNLNFNFIVDTNATSNDADYLTIQNCAWYGLGATSGTAVIKMDGTNTKLTVTDNYFKHAATSDAGLMPIAAGKVVTFARILRNTIQLVSASGATTGLLITTNQTTNSGEISGNYIKTLDATAEILVTGSSGFNFWENKHTAVADLSGYLVPAADA